MTRRSLDPRIVNVAIDANACNRHGDSRDHLVDRLLKLSQEGKIRLIVPQGVRCEIQDPRTPGHVQTAILSQIFTLPVGLTDQEQRRRRSIATALQGNAKLGKHDADAAHIFEAAKYSGYLITHDNRILKRVGAFVGRPPSLTIVTLVRFFEIFDEYVSAEQEGRLPFMPVTQPSAVSATAQPLASDLPGWLVERGAEKQRAVRDVRRALTLAQKRRRELDPWEREHFAAAVGALFRGAYRLASADALLALTPTSEREPASRVREELRNCDFPTLWQAFAAAENEPVRRSPHFGRIVFSEANA